MQLKALQAFVRFASQELENYKSLYIISSLQTGIPTLVSFRREVSFTSSSSQVWSANFDT